ncbi:hypothetical protein RND71_024289 [Anisodus tanguticus]|uniref:gibberellin 2beta-dioxygenase n=1 Tax=Anisodus tanguticus TaxID=243964 RepID=A0AAE1RP89_9SOLA|nr:hypothetical protein RND71_024289 [Anisodus tanguticus]
MVVLTKSAIEHFPIVKNPCKFPSFFNDVPVIDLSKSDSKNLIVKACEEFGFFKVINHNVPMEFISKLESEAIKFFSSPLSEKLKAGPADPFGYGNKKIGQNGDIGRVEYILLSTDSEFNYQKFASILGVNPETIRSAVDDYVSAVKKMSCEILEMLAEGLKINPKYVFSKLLIDEKSDSVFRLNHYPPCPDIQEFNGKNLIGFGEHTDPQIISVLRSNNTSGLQILLKDGHWISVPPDQNSFFINVGDSLQVHNNNTHHFRTSLIEQGKLYSYGSAELSSSDSNLDVFRAEKMMCFATEQLVMKEWALFQSVLDIESLRQQDCRLVS